LTLGFRGFKYTGINERTIVAAIAKRVKRTPHKANGINGKLFSEKKKIFFIGKIFKYIIQITRQEEPQKNLVYVHVQKSNVDQVG
jgi:hypothetical protein